jgi:hypothetical protein
LINAEALDILEACGLSALRRRQVAQLLGETIMEDATMQALLGGCPRKNPAGLSNRSCRV